MARSPRIRPNSEALALILQMYSDGVPLTEIGRDPRIRKDHTTVLYHIQKAGIARSGPVQRKRKYFITPKPVIPKIPEKTDFGPGRCSDCGVKLDLMPNHNCAPGHYYQTPPEDRFGNSFGD